MERLFAPAKLNLGLWILGRRPDGYHELLSLMIPLTLGDELVAEPSAQLQIEYRPAHHFDRDLVWEAAQRLRAETKVRQGAKILVHKRIPVGAGLGGGSSDAAATLHLLNRLWHTGLSLERLIVLGRELGSDVPFFLLRRAALVRGRGERVEPLALRLPYWFLILYPGFAIATAWAYKQLGCPPGIREEPAIPWHELLWRLERDPALLERVFRNEFEPMLFRHYPQLRTLRDELRRVGALYAAVTGSGSAVFGVFDSEHAAQRAARRWGGTLQSFVCQMFTETQP
ncbi:4-diphosphocytidyl-2-C-methyl-D-erythritol kinase [bacterium HR21]|nr:4-diphosphocytidyl-2-C-methyl-D-erythritol kinase [bacterium HR21]